MSNCGKTNTPDPKSLRDAAEFLREPYFANAKARLLAEADRLDKAAKEADLNMKIGIHFKDAIKAKLGWTFTILSNDDLMKIGEIIREAVETYDPKTKKVVVDWEKSKGVPFTATGTFHGGFRP